MILPTELSARPRHNLLYIPVAVAPCAEPVHQVRDGQQAIGRERAPAGPDHHERVRRHIGPSRRQREQLPVLVVQVNPVLAPVLPVRHELEVAAVQRMERVRHPNPSIPIIWIGCS
jgi:hypothetical protein